MTILNLNGQAVTLGVLAKIAILLETNGEITVTNAAKANIVGNAALSLGAFMERHELNKENEQTSDQGA